MRKALTLFGIAFVAYFLFSEPEGMADVISTIGSGFADAFESIITFFTELF